MRPLLKSKAATALALLLTLATGCGEEAAEIGGTPVAAPPPDTLAPRYLREYVYLGERDGSPLAVPLVFRSVSRGDGIERTARAGLAHGETWDRFVDENWTTMPESGVWRVLPRGELRLAVGGPTEVEAFWYRRGERSLRLNLQRPISGWFQGNSARYRLIAGQLQLGPEATQGVILESLQVHRPGGAGRDSDLLFLTSGDSLRLVLGETLAREGGAGRGFAWSWTEQGERSWERAEIRWLELRAYDEARRDIPLHWTFRVPEAGIHGEVSALGLDVRVGAERPGRRAVEIRYTVEGWVEIGDARSPVIGVIRHVQE